MGRWPVPRYNLLRSDTNIAERQARADAVVAYPFHGGAIEIIGK
jgi:hypothetical protein